MIIEFETASVRFEGGVCVAILKVTTDRGVVGMTTSFALSEHPELDGLLPIIDRELRQACTRALGLTAQKNPELKS